MTKELLDVIIEGIQDKKGEEIIDIDLTSFENSICDHFIICHAESGTQVNAIADAVDQKVKENLQIKKGHKEGFENALWVLLDYYDIVVHVFEKQTRFHYNLEELWGDAKIEKIECTY